MTRHINPSHVWDTVHGEVELRSDHLYDLMGLQVSPSYIIYKDGDMVKAKNGKMGVIEFSGSDAATVIQSAINALKGVGGEVLIRSGDYVLNSGIVIPSDGYYSDYPRTLRLRGESWRSTRLFFNGSGGAIIELENPSQYHVVENLSLYGTPRLPQSGDSPDDLFKADVGLKLVRPDSTYWHGGNVFRDLLICYCKSRGIELVNSEENKFQNVAVNGIGTETITGYGVYISDSYEGTRVSCQRNTFLNCYFTKSRYNFKLEGGQAMLIDCYFYGAYDDWLMPNTYGDMLLDPDSTFGNGYPPVILMGCHFEGKSMYNVKVGFNISNPHYIYFVGCRFMNRLAGTNCLEIKYMEGAFISCVMADGSANKNIVFTDSRVNPAQVKGATLSGSYRVENGGVATFSGDGSTTQFAIEHGLVSEPSVANVTPMSSDAVGDFYVTKDSTYIYVNYLTAPPSGTDNVVLSWRAEV